MLLRGSFKLNWGSPAFLFVYFIFCMNMVTRIKVLLLLLVICGSSIAADITYTKTDSLKVVKLLTEGNKAYAANKNLNLMIYYGNKLCGLLYVGRTLEVNKTEKLVVNLTQLDCTTYVETVFALSLTTKQGSVKWTDYCNNLQSIRYANGKPEGYVSRNHYFLWWIERNKARGFVTTPMDDNMKKLVAEKKMLPSYIAKQTIKINYMSTHSDVYPMLKGNKNDISKIASMEKQSNGKVVYYIPAGKTGLNKQRLGNYVKDGDILAIATKKAGLDTSHIGIASWGKDGKLHLLNASQVRKKVVLEPMTLLQYMKKHPTHLGIWVIHPNL